MPGDPLSHGPGAWNCSSVSDAQLTYLFELILITSLPVVKVSLQS